MEMWRTRPAAVSTLRNAFDRLWDEALGGASNAESSTPGFQSLPLNVWETSEGYQVAMLAPGLDEQSINVTVQDENLIVEGDLRVQAPEGSRVVWQEFSPGPSRFRRSVRLGSAVDPSKAEALYKNGLLLLSMAKAEHARPRQIQVQVAANGEH